MGIRQRPSFQKLTAYYQEDLGEKKISSMANHTSYKRFSEFTIPFNYKELEDKRVRYKLTQLWNVESTSMIIETSAVLPFKKGDRVIINGVKNDITELDVKTLQSNTLRNKQVTRKVYRLLIG